MMLKNIIAVFLLLSSCFNAGSEAGHSISETKPAAANSSFINEMSERYQLRTDSVNFSSYVNPTGQPIGGGIGYKNIVLKSQAGYIVSDKLSLIKSLELAKSGQVIYIDDTCSIDLTGEKNLIIPRGVTLASGRGHNNSDGALIFSNDLFPEMDYAALFVTGGNDVRITGLRIKGPTPEIWDHDLRRGFSNAIRCLHPNLEVDNCELWAWNKWAIWLYIENNAYIHHNYIHHTMVNGYGYLVWCGGSGTETNANALIEANLFEAGRHAIASSGHANSWEARYNVILRRELYINLDRHRQGKTIYGGRNTIVKRNLIFSTQKHYSFASPVDSNGRIEICNNYFMRDTVSAGVAGPVALPHQSANNVKVHDNYYNGGNRRLPVAVLDADVTEGICPLTVKFNSRASYDDDSIPIIRSVWRFGDGDFSGNEKRIPDPVYSFTMPGAYNVTLVVYNAYGIPSNVVQKKIIVHPKDQTKYILSGWIKDSYPGTLRGIYSKQILIDNAVVWDSDVAGDSGWQHVVIDMSRYGTKGTTHRIAVRMLSVAGVNDYKNQIPELCVWMDDFYAFNTDMHEGDCEVKKIYPPWNQAFSKYGGVSTTITSEDCRSGEQSFQLRYPFQSVVPAGSWGEFYTYVLFK